MMRLAWSISLVASIAAYLAVIVPAHRAVAVLENQARALYDSANRNERLVARAQDVNHAERGVEDEVARLAGHGGMDALLDVLDRESRRVHVRVIAVTPGATENVKREALRSASVGIELQGSFPDLLALLEGLSSGAALMGLDSIELTLAEATSHRAPMLHATLGAHLYNLAAGNAKGTIGESTGTIR